MSSGPAQGVSSFSDGTIADQRSNLYPNEVWYGIGLFIFILGVFNWLSVLHSKLSRSGRDADPESSAAPRTAAFSFRRLPLALVNAYRVVAFRWTLDIGNTLSLTGAEIMLTIAYIIYLYTWAFINTTNLSGVKLDWTYWSTRIAMLATSQFPLITVLGTKNNVISLVTGIGYDKLSYLHRAMARVVFTMLWVHAGTEIVRNVPSLPSIQVTWLICGMTAITAYSLLIIISLRPIRAVAYELFFYAHFALVLIMLVCAYFHTGQYTYNIFIWPSLIIWGFDRVLRVIRLMVFNYSYFGLFSGSITDAIVKPQSEDFVRVRIRRPLHFHWSPGQTVCLTMPAVSRIPFEAHPFTIASLDSQLFRASHVGEKNISEPMKKETATVKVKALGSSSSLRDELVFFLNAREGFTARLKKAAVEGRPVKVFVDGPYGVPPDIRSYDVSVLIAGGTGISYILPTFLGIVGNVREDKSACRKAVLIWAIRDEGCIQWVEETLSRALQLAPPYLTTLIRIHLTGNRPRVTVDTGQGASQGSLRDYRSASVNSLEESSLASFDSVKISKGRPNLPAILREELDSATGRVSVSVCGSSGIARTVRQSLRFPVSSPSNVLRGGPSVALFVESYGYA